MATNNPIDSLDPIQVALGGTGDASLTQYGILYGNGTGSVGVTSSGSSGQVLASGGGLSAPFWTNVGAQLVKISRQYSPVGTGGTTVLFNSGISVTYNTYMIIVDALDDNSGHALDYMQFSTNGGSTWITSGYTCGNVSWAPSTWSNVNTTGSLFVNNATVALGRTVVWLYGLTSGSNPMMTSVNSGYGSPGGYIGGTCSTGSINAIKIYTSDGSGYNLYDATLYGLLE